MGISDYLLEIEKLTNTNLKLLKTLNDAFYTDQSHLSVDLGENGTYVIPSFMMLENKINALQSNFENLVDSPVTSEAHFIFDGNSRAIEVKKYEQSPSPLILSNQSFFHHENNNILKDFLTPVPYVRFNLNNLPNDITRTITRKVSAISDEAKTRFSTLLSSRRESETSPSASVNWGDFKKILDGLVQDKDYTLYDTTKDLPTRKGQGTGSYVITEIISDTIDDNLDQHVTLRFANNIDGYQKTLSYLLFDQTIEKRLEVGDYLVTWDGTVKFEIEELNFNTNTIKMRLCFGDYTNIYPHDEGASVISDVSKMRFFSTHTLFEDDNYVKVPLEEDRYIFIAIAPLNNRMNIRAPWGDGLIIDVDGLINAEAEEGQDDSFRAYYDNCRNIGDILNEISKAMENTTTSHTRDELVFYMNTKPTIDTDILQVVNINKHLDDSTTVKNIRALYSQKNSYNASLVEIQNSLTSLQETLSSIDFEDTTGIRSQTQNQIDELTRQKNELINSLIKISDEIALTANNSIVPLEGAKYRIRGFFDFKEFVSEILAEHSDYKITEKNIKGISVQYRYRNPQQEIGTAQTFIKDYNGNGEVDEGDKTFIYSDWNQLYTPLRLRKMDRNGNYDAEEDTSNMNVPSFNQIDIPISQGEIVDVRLKVIYDFGYPFIQMMSDWSNVTTFEFPVEYLKDVSVVTIIEENNNDIETNRFKTILSDDGVTDHVNDKIQDQDSTYFHKPENISSGFYTEERRIIPLRDKLKDMDDSITRILDEINGTSATQLQVSFDYDESTIALSPYETGHAILKSYDSFAGQQSGSVGNYEWDGNKASILCNIHLTNTSNHSLKIFPMFLGSDSQSIDNSLRARSKFDPGDFYSSIANGDTIDTSNSSSVWISQLVNNGSGSMTRSLCRQSTNQIITFRTRNPWNGEFYYASDDVYSSTPNEFISAYSESVPLGTSSGMSMYPYLINPDGLKLTYEESSKYMVLDHNDDIVIPVKVEYNFSETSDSSYSKTMSFDVRTSLYEDPSTYTFVIETPNNTSTEDKLVSTLTREYDWRAMRKRNYLPIVK